MEKSSIDISSLYELLMHELSSLHDAANQVVDILPRMAQAASAPEVRYGFEEHVAATTEQLRRLDSIFDELDAQPNPLPCDAMTGIICEINNIIEAEAPADIKDAALISAARKMENYAVSGYGAARTYARIMELDNILEMLQRTLDIETSTNQQLEEIIERSINLQASGG